ncbi:MAG: HD domain-containing protein [Daejeonella sp.]|uniref:HD domain-containing protein n=1 Tax=Daejeonella sp. TaxID=2805397 RepID=UPI003C7925A6
MKAVSVIQNQENKTIVAQTESFVKDTLEGAEAGHDWWHIHRVYKNAELILKTEKADHLVVELAVLLHDIADSKFNGGDEEMGPQKAGDFLRSIQVDENIIGHVQEIIRNMSFRSGLGAVNFHSKELEIVQDADRLDAIGAMGIARAFTYGGHKNREIYNPQIPPVLNMTKEEYKNNSAPTINHFYEKLLLLKDKMNTEAGRRIATERHRFMETYLKQFENEWNGVS